MSNQTHSFTGNLTRDPESRTVSTANGDTTVVSFSVAVNGRKPEETVYFECEAWGKQAETIVGHFKKGKPIVINDAEARMDNWVDKNTNEKRSRLKFRVNRFGFAPNGGGKGDDVDTEPDPVVSPQSKQTKAGTGKRQTAPPPEQDDNIPF